MRMNKEVVMVRLSDIIPNRFQPRLTFDEEALNELSSSIKEHGIIQPLILRDLGNKYEIIAGERRYKAASLAGLTEVPAIIGSMDDQTSAELALIENIQRKDLSAIEEAKSYKKILEMGNFTQEELAQRMGKSQPTIANKMRLLALTNEVQVALMNNLISERHARCLLQIKDENLQKEVLNKVISERMNVRATDEYIKGLLNNETITSTNEDIMEENKAPELKAEEPINLPVEDPVIPENNEREEINMPISNNISDNPNVYTQTKNSDFVNLNSLDNIEEISPTEIDKPNEVEIATPEIENENHTELKEEPFVTDLDNIISNPETDLSTVKLATAIRLAKDTVEDIKTAGYNVTLEESNKGSTYDLIIKVEK